MKSPYWETKSLAEMTEQEWEALCDGCAKCCLHKLQDEDTDEVYYTNVACSLLDSHSCRCKDYENRFNSHEECLKITAADVEEFTWLPSTCAYRRLHEGQALPSWHPLLTGSKKAMGLAGESVRDNVVYEIDVIDWEDHIINLPQSSDEPEQNSAQ